ncbi:MAG: transglutaminase-like domain-containing protein [bacterium]
MRKNQTIKVLLLLLFCAGTCLSSCIVKTQPKEGGIAGGNYVKEAWYNLYDQEEKIGFIHHIIRDLSYEGQPAREIREETKKIFQRFGTRIEESSTSRVLLRKDFRPISFLIRERVSRDDRLLEGRFRDGVLKVVETIGRSRRVKSFKLDEDTCFVEALDGKILESGLRTGKDFKFKIFDVQLQKITFVDISVIREAELEIGNEPTKAFLLRTRHQEYPQIEMLTWMAPDGTILKEDADLLAIRSQKTSPEDAQKMDVVADLGYSSMIRSSSRVPHARRVTGATMEVYFMRGDLKPILEHPPVQRVYPSGLEKQVTLTTEARQADPGRSLLLPVQNPDMKPYLEPNVFIQCDDPEIKKQALLIVGGEKNAVLAAEKLSYWVYRNVREKNLATGFASACETLRTRTGDCTEHSLLLAALARAAGIPSRVISGLVYVTGNFVYHMWVEVFTGAWQSMDPSLGLSMVDALHIRLYEASMEPASFFLSGLAIQQTVGNLGVKILRYSSGGRSFVVNSADPGYRLTGNTYEDTVYGFRLKLGKGWEVSTPSGVPSVLAGFVNQPALSSITISVEELSSADSYPMLLEEIRNQFKKEKEIRLISFQRDLKFKGMPAARISLEGKQLMLLLPSEVKQLVVLDGTVVFILTANYPKNSPGRIRQEALDIVESFTPLPGADRP